MLGDKQLYIDWKKIPWGKETSGVLLIFWLVLSLTWKQLWVNRNYSESCQSAWSCGLIRKEPPFPTLPFLFRFCHSKFKSHLLIPEKASSPSLNNMAIKAGIKWWLSHSAESFYSISDCLQPLTRPLQGMDTLEILICNFRVKTIDKSTQRR